MVQKLIEYEASGGWPSQSFNVCNCVWISSGQVSFFVSLILMQFFWMSSLFIWCMQCNVYMIMSWNIYFILVWCIRSSKTRHAYHNMYLHSCSVLIMDSVCGNLNFVFQTGGEILAGIYFSSLILQVNIIFQSFGMKIIFIVWFLMAAIRLQKIWYRSPQKSLLGRVVSGNRMMHIRPYGTQ
jgi:hypothetical protein